MDTFKEENERINLSMTMQECVDICMATSTEVLSCLQHCLAMGGNHSDPRHINLLNECSLICRTAASFMISTSNFAHELCTLTARIADATADSLNRIDPEDPHMQRTTAACRECADACRHLDQ